MGKISDALTFGLTIRESLADGSDFTNPPADYRRLFLGEDGMLHVKNEAGTVSNPYSGASEITDIATAEMDDTLVLAPDGAGGVEFRAEVGGSSDIVQVASGAGSIIIPGLAASPDIRVAGASDDEFDSTDTSDPMTGWTTLGAPTAHDINSTAKSHYYVSKDATAGPAQHGIYKAISVPFTVTCKITDVTLNGNDNCVGVFVGEASPGKQLITALYYNSAVSTKRKIQTQKFTNPTTYSSTTAAIDGNFDVPIYLRMVAASSTNISAYYSVGGLVWRTIVVSNNPSFTVESVGLFIQQNNASYDMKAVFDWIRIS